jgi:hypothetical protein
MRLTTLFVLVALSVSASAFANPYVLKCTDENGSPIVDLTVDIDRLVMTFGWAKPNYIITKITDRYITALEDQHVMTTAVGGEVWVLDRVTGEYKRGGVAMLCDYGCKDGAKLTTYTYFGKCARPMF